MARARIRTYPWPYRAALAFSSDCDFLTLDAMLSLHRLFATPPSEGGFGLEWSDSFFFYAVASKWPCYSYFNSLSNTETSAAPLIRELVRSGHFDTVHGLGDFETGGYRREMARWALESFAKHGLKVPVWSNHGGWQNRQNIGEKNLCYYHGGDDFSSPFYLLDIIEELGVRYVWTDGLLSKRMPQTPEGQLVSERQRRAPKVRYIWPRQQIQEHYEPRWTFDRGELFTAVETRAGNALQGFVRYDGFMIDGDNGNPPERLVKPDGVRPGPNLGRLGDTLADAKLDRLVREEGVVVLYQHFSTLAHLPERTHLTRELEFHPENVRRLKALKKREEAGEIWVAGTALLLDYLYTARTIEADVRPASSESVAIRLKPRSGYAYRGAAGLTIELGKHPLKATAIEPDGHEIPCATVGPDDDGNYWATIPLRRLPHLDWLALAREHGVAMNEDLSVALLDGERGVDLNLPARLPGSRRPIATV